MTDDTRIYPTLRAANQARQAEWDKDERISLSYRGNELAGETGEACNIIKKLDRERLGIRGSRATVEQLAEELADILICVDLIAMGEGIDMQAALVAKFNSTSEKVGLKTRLAAPAAAERDEEVKRMVDRFLAWRLPDNFSPDGGISFKATFNDHLPKPTRHQPSGTNLLDATQAEAMVRHMLGDTDG